MARSRELHDRHGGQPGFGQGQQPQSQHPQQSQTGNRGVFGRQPQAPQAPDAGPALPWHTQDPSTAAQQPYPDQTQGYYQQDPHGYPQQQHGYYPNDPYAQQGGGDAYYGHYFQQGQQPQHGQQPVQGGYYQGHPQQGGYPAQPQQQHYADPRTGYDLGAYNTQQVPRTQPPQPGHGYPPAQQHGYDAAGYPPQDQDHDPEHDEDFQDYEDEVVEEPKSRFRSLLVVGSLIGAIALGAGLAYGYKKFGGGISSGKPPILKADAGQARVRADGTDGKKVVERLDGPAPAVVPARAPDAPSGGPRVVQTIPVSPNGTLIASAPPQQPQAPQPSPLRPTISVPGMAVDNLPPSGPPPQAAAPQTPQIISAPAGRAVAPAPTPAQPAVIASAPVEKTPVQKTTKVAAAYSAPTAAAAPSPAPRASNGYVAVLSSQGSRIEALKAYADLQQKYNSVLGGKPADVQEATVNGKVWYRAVVGPPGSRNAAADLCAQLRTAGHSACFPAAY